MSKSTSIKKIIAGISIAIVCLEFSFRFVGLNTPLLYEKTEYGYRVKPSQNIHRLGGHLLYNSDGLRNSPQQSEIKDNSLRILAIGDSITFGGATISNTETYPGQLSTLLEKENIHNIVLNASAAGWSISNELGWLKKNGFYDSKYSILEIGENDISQKNVTSEIIDQHPAFPSHQPTFAIEHILERYIIPKILNENTTDPGAGNSKSSTLIANDNLIKITEIINLTQKSNSIPIVVYIDSQRRFYKSKNERELEQYFISEIKKSAPYFIQPFENIKANEFEVYFRDAVHPNTLGNSIIANSILGIIKNLEQPHPN